MLKYFRKRAVVSDGTVENERNSVLDAVVYYAVVDILPLDEIRYRAVRVYGVYRIKVIVMSVEMEFLILDVTAEGRSSRSWVARAFPASSA